jgi:hypothetical protein
VNTTNLQFPDGTKTAYFRGRKLQGKAVKLPEGYRGAVATTPAAEQTLERLEDVGVIDLEPEMPQGSLQVQAEFDEMIVWGQGAGVDASDPYLRGAEEWVALAEKVGYQVTVYAGQLIADIHSRTDPRVSRAGEQVKARYCESNGPCDDTTSRTVLDEMPQQFTVQHKATTLRISGRAPSDMVSTFLLVPSS